MQEKEKHAQAEQEKNPKSSLLEYLTLIIGAGAIIALDQWTKSLILEHIPFLGSWLPPNMAQLEPYYRIVHWRNSGAAFGIFQNGNLIFMILAVIASLFIFIYYPLINKTEKFLKVAMIFQLGGAVGNLIDRIRFGYVIDFISIGDFPVFNVADAAISTGVAVLLLSVLYQEYREYRARTRVKEFKLPAETDHDLLKENE
jgi:signal peptidase II